MKSYNCFYSALFEVLEQYYRENTHLLINNRIQFFYRRNSKKYSDDYRIIGEHPLLFDKEHLQQMFLELGISVEFRKIEGTIDELHKYLSSKGYVVTFANLYVLNGEYTTIPSNRCVTTIVIKKLKDDIVEFISYDNGKKINVVAKKVLSFAWENASEYEFLNKSIVIVSCNKTLEKRTYDAFFRENLISSVKTYLNTIGGETLINGNRGLRAFANDVCNLKISNSKKIINCAMYMELIIRQRECLAATCMNTHAHDELKCTYDMILYQWKKIKMILFVIAQRKQFDSLKFIGGQIYELAEMELGLVDKIYNKWSKEC